MKTILALASGAALFVAASAANAQDCVGGYMMLKEQIPVKCDAGFGAEQIGIAPVQPAPEEPMYTGSINASAGEPTGLGTGGGNANELPSAMAAPSSREDCVAGHRWIETPANGDTLPMRC